MGKCVATQKYICRTIDVSFAGKKPNNAMHIVSLFRPFRQHSLDSFIHLDLHISIRFESVLSRKWRGKFLQEFI